MYASHPRRWLSVSAQVEQSTLPKAPRPYLRLEGQTRYCYRRSVVRFILNGAQVELPDADTPLLWVLRDQLSLKGTKYGCGAGLCGACTVQVDDEAVRSCQVRLTAIDGKRVKTIEGLSPDGNHLLQSAWQELQVPQCGYCQSGQLMAADALLKRTPRPTENEVAAALEGNLCRCGTYHRIRKAVLLAAERSG